MKKVIKAQNGDERTRDYTFITCPKHGISYPKGSECPKCAEERKSGN